MFKTGGDHVHRVLRFLQYTLITLMLVGVLASAFPDSVHAITVSCPTPMTTSTIQMAINSANPGDTISVSGPCVYSENLTIDKPGLHLTASPEGSVIIDGQGLGTVVNVTSDNVEIRGFTIRNSDEFGWGIHVHQSNGVNITGNTVSASVNGDGVNLYKANNTLISNNMFASNLYAVNVVGSRSERITGNQAILNDTVGVQLQDSSKSLIYDNTFAGGEDGVDIVQSSNNNVTRNLFKGMKIFGVLLVTRSYSTVPSQFPQNNTINENTFQRNHIGVNIQNATMNTFYHNDFFASGYRHANAVASSSSSVLINSPNYWDNGTLGGVPGGNYWDNYNGTDANSNGIGDTPYVIDSGNRDSYPLILPFLPVPILVRAILASPLSGNAPLTVTLSAQILGTLTPFTYLWDFGDGSPKVGTVGATHTYGKPGNYTVTLTAKDGSGASDSSSLIVRVTTGTSYVVPILVGVLAALMGVGGFLFWRRRGRKRAAAVQR